MGVHTYSVFLTLREIRTENCEKCAVFTWNDLILIIISI